MFKRYACPDGAGWLGWFEDTEGNVTAFVGLDKKVLFVADLDGDT